MSPERCGADRSALADARPCANKRLRMGNALQPLAPLESFRTVVRSPPKRQRKVLFVGFPGGDPCGVVRRISAMSGDKALSDLPIECDSLDCVVVDVESGAKKRRMRLMMWQISPQRPKSGALWRHFYEDVDAIVVVVPSFDDGALALFQKYKASVELPSRARLLLALDAADSDGLVAESAGAAPGVDDVTVRIDSQTGEGIDALVERITKLSGTTG